MPRRGRAQSLPDFTMVIHGTRILGKQPLWCRRGDPFVESMNNVIPGVWRVLLPGENTMMNQAEFLWSGDNTHIARVNAGGNLYDDILARLEDRNSGAMRFNGINIVTHSHGGNVVLLALRRLVNNCRAFRNLRIGFDSRVKNIIFLGTPWVRLRYGSGNRYDWLYYHSDVFEAITGRFYNIYSEEDAVQVDLAELRNGIDTESQISRREGFEGIEVIRRGPDASGGRGVINIHQATDVGPGNLSTDAHSVLHSSMMGTAIGHLLRGLSWDEARRRANIPSTITNGEDKGESSE